MAPLPQGRPKRAVTAFNVYQQEQEGKKGDEHISVWNKACADGFAKLPEDEHARLQQIADEQNVP